MIPVVLAPEPLSFDAKIRRPGLSAINELVGLPPLVRRPGRRRAAVASTKAKIPADEFPPFWRQALDDMMTAYEQRCAYLAMFIELTGSPTVDHVTPKSRAWNRVYEWTNYRLCTGIVNSKKKELVNVVDPVDARVGWFELNLATFQVVRGAAAPSGRRKKIDATLPLLNVRDCCLQRKQYVEDYLRGPGAKGIDFTYLEHRAPFIAAELRRQGQLVRGDV